MANIKIRDLPLYSEQDSNRTEAWLMVAQSGLQNGRKTCRISLDNVAPIDSLSGLIKNNRENIALLSGDIDTVSGNVNTVATNLIETGRVLESAGRSELLAFSTGLNPLDPTETGYLVNDKYRPNLTLVRGKKYKITANLPEAPLWFTKTPNGGASVLGYEIGRPKSENGNETPWGGPLMFFTVPEDLPSNVFYQSYSHGDFGGKIHVTNGLLFDSDQDTSITLDSTGTSSYETNTITMKASGEKVLCLTSTEVKVEKPFFVNGSGDISGNLRVRGDLTVNGGYTQIDTNVQTTEQMSITNDGTGPAIIANQKGTQPIINFQDDGSSVFFVDNGGLIGLSTASPEVTLDINTTDAIKLPAGVSAQRPSLAGSSLSGMIRFNTESGIYEGYRDSEWKEMGGGVIDKDKDTYITPESSADSDALEFYTSGVKRFEISSSGNVSISGAALLHSTLDVSGATVLSGTLGVSGQADITGAALLHSTLDVSGATALSGTLGVSGQADITGATLLHSTLDVSGATTLSGALDAKSTVGISGLTNINDELRVKDKITLGGDLLCSGDIIAFYSTSDINLKENICPIENPVEKIKKINGVEFDWKEGFGHERAGHDIGVIAQEIEAVIPEAVLTRKNGIKSVEYTKIIPLLIECINNQEKRIKELEKNVNTKHKS